MPKLLVISGKELVKIFIKFGYEIDYQTGNHIILRHRDPSHRN